MYLNSYQRCLATSSLLIIVLNFVRQVDTEKQYQPTLKDFLIVSEGVMKIAKKLCLTSDGCYTEFLKLNNYCCQGICCNIVQYIFYDAKDEQALIQNLLYTFENPRAINVILIVLIIVLSNLLICFMIAVFLKVCMRCFCRRKSYPVPLMVELLPLNSDANNNCNNNTCSGYNNRMIK
jgi:hypothetical protein